MRKSLKEVQAKMSEVKEKLSRFEDGPEMYAALEKVWSNAAKTSSLMADTNVKAAIDWLEARRDFLKNAILMAPVEKTDPMMLKGAVAAYQVYDRFLAVFDPERMTVASDAFQTILDSEKLKEN